MEVKEWAIWGECVKYTPSLRKIGKYPFGIFFEMSIVKKVLALLSNEN